MMRRWIVWGAALLTLTACGPTPFRVVDAVPEGGQQLAFLQMAEPRYGDLYVLDEDSGEATRITAGNQIGRVRWSPAGDQLALVVRIGPAGRSEKTQLVILDATTGETVSATDDISSDGGNIGPATWSGSQLAFAFNTGGAENVYLYDDGSTTALTDFPDTIRQIRTLSWTADGKALLFDASAETGQPPAMYRLDIASGEMQDLGQGYNPVPSPDGTQIAFTAEIRPGARVIHVADADGSNARPLFDQDGGFFWPAWSPDGTLIAYVEEIVDQWGGIVEQDLYLTDLEKSWQVGKVDTEEGVFPRWQPEGTLLYNYLESSCWLTPPYREPDCQVYGNYPLPDPAGGVVAYVKFSSEDKAYTDLCLDPGGCVFSGKENVFPVGWRP